MNEPELSLILATDTYATIRAVVERCRKQTARDRIELVLVAPSAGAVSEVLAYRGEFAAIKIVEDPVDDLSTARAVGIRAASAPIVFVGETHSYPHPRCAEAVLESFSGPWSSVAAALDNANPNGTWSWASFLSDYGRWADVLPAGEIAEAPLYNAGYRRPVLLQLGDGLARALTPSGDLALTLRAGGHRIFFQPEARLDHANVARPWDFVRQRFVNGLVLAAHRARPWPVSKRLVYIAGSFLIPVVLIWRILPGVWGTVRRKRLPLATIPAIVAGMIIKSAGELAGYAGAPAESADRWVLEFEVHKMLYAGRSRT